MNAIPAHAVAWFEIPVSDMDKAKDFYAAVLGNALTDENDGPNPMSMFAAGEKGRSGHIYPGRPATAGTGPTVHLTVTGSLGDAVARVSSHGGSVVTPIIEIPAGRFAYCTDPDGNSFGLFK